MAKTMTIDEMVHAGAAELRNTMPSALPSVVRWMADRAIENEAVEFTPDQGLRAEWSGRFNDERDLVQQLKSAAEKGAGRISKPKGINAPYFRYTFDLIMGDTTRVYEVSLNGKVKFSVFDL